MPRRFWTEAIFEQEKPFLRGVALAVLRGLLHLPGEEFFPIFSAFGHCIAALAFGELFTSDSNSPWTLLLKPPQLWEILQSSRKLVFTMIRLAVRA